MKLKQIKAELNLKNLKINLINEVIEMENISTKFISVNNINCWFIH